MDINEALEKINQMGFPQVSEGDSVQFQGFWFIYQEGSWILDETKNNT